MKFLVVPFLVSGLAVSPARGKTLPDGFRDSLVVGGLDIPVGMAFLPDGRLLVTEQRTARIRLIVHGALAPGGPVATLPGVNPNWGEQGLLGIAVDPGWPARPYVYVHYDRADAANIRIARFTVTGDLNFSGAGSLAIDPASRYDILNDIPDNADNHNGGTLRFGPDHLLYVSLGEDASPCAAQDSVSLRGVILRLDVSNLPPGPGGPADKAALVAAGNPFATHPNLNARLVWALGLRNPFRFHIDTNGDLFVADVGQDTWEEIDWVRGPGENFGWPIFEGPQAYSTCSNVIDVEFTNPIHFINRSGSAAVISGGVYHEGVPCIPEADCAFPNDYDGDYFFSDYYSGVLRRLKRSGDTWALAPPAAGQPTLANWGTGFRFVSDYLVGPDGALWYCLQTAGDFEPGSGQIRQVFAVAGAPPSPRPPTLQFLAPRPSPAQGSVTLAYSLSTPAHVVLRVFDSSGRAVRSLVDATQSPGVVPFEVVWDGRDVKGNRAPPGVYFARLRIGGVEMTRRFPLTP